MKSSCARATSRRLSKDKGVTRFRVLYTHRCSCNDTVGTIDTSLLRLAKARAQFLVVRYWNEDETKFYAYLIILKFPTNLKRLKYRQFYLYPICDRIINKKLIYEE